VENQQLKRLVTELEKTDFSISKETRQAFIEYASEREVLNAFKSLLSRGTRHIRVKVVDILSDIHSQQAFELLFYALHDPYRDIRDRVMDNLKKGKNTDTRLPPEYQKTLEALQRAIHGSDDPKKISEIIDEHDRNKRRKFYFLPLIENRLNNDKDMDLTVRGNLLSILAHHEVLKEIDHLIDTMRYGTFEAKKHAIDRLNEIADEKMQEKIQYAMVDVLEKELYPPIRDQLTQALHNPLDNTQILGHFFTSADWFAEAVLYFKSLGFYQEYHWMADDDLIEKIKVTRYYQLGKKPTRITDFLLILAEDKQRVWYHDTELYWYGQFVKFLKEWGDISHGEFMPENISETVNKTDEKICLKFRHKGQDFEITANYYGEWINLEVLEEINQILTGSHIQLCNIITDTQEACVVSLTAMQKMRLEKDLGLQFDFSGRYIPPPEI